jgi:hypothetical protein
MADFPTTIDEIDAPWLTHSLQSAGALDGAEVVGFDVDSIGVGVGIMGLLYRIRLRYDRDGAGPATVVVKLPTDGPGARHVARVFRFYEKEIGFYRDLAARTPMTTPQCLLARHDLESDDFVLVLADITDGEVHSQLDGCPPDDAHIAARSLARHHAAFADSALFERPELAWLPFGSDSPTPEGVIQGVGDSWPVFREMFPEHVTPELESIVPRYLESIHELMEIPEGRPVTLAHGDYRLDNLFFTANGSGGSGSGDRSVTVIDWQICAKTGFAYDLAYFLTQSLTIDDRRTHEAAIIDSYFDELAAAGFHHDRDDFMRDYRVTTMFCLCYPLQSGGVELVNDRARTLVSGMFERSMAAIADHDATEFLVS